MLYINLLIATNVALVIALFNIKNRVWWKFKNINTKVQNWLKKYFTFYILLCIIIYVISARTCFLQGKFAMHTPLDDVYVCWRQLPTGVTNVCRHSLIGWQTIFGRKSRVAEKRSCGDRKKEWWQGSDRWGEGGEKRGAPSKEGGVSPRNAFASSKK